MIMSKQTTWTRIKARQIAKWQKLGASEDKKTKLALGWPRLGPSWGDVRRFWGQSSPDLLQTTTHSHTSTMNI